MQNFRAHIRQLMRQRRLQLSPERRTHAATQLAQHLCDTSVFQQATHVACFISNDGEIDTSPLIRACWQQNKQIYLPVLAADGQQRLVFRHYTEGSAMQPNRYGIPEPSTEIERTVSQLDLVFVPLVAFDATGNRLGMGAGYYDRTFADFHQRPNQLPRLVGLAYAFQQVVALPVQPWDVPLWAVATEDGLQRCSGKNN